MNIAPLMVPVTAVCWVLLMVGAMVTHIRQGGYRFVVLNLVYLALAAQKNRSSIVWGRFGPHAFTG